MIMTEVRQCWYLVQAKPNCAAKARRHLERQGFRTFMPLEQTCALFGPRKAPATRPYFPGYLFVEIRPDSGPWQAIRSTYGVAQLVTFGTSPAPVPQQIVDQLMQHCDTNGVMQAPAEVLAPGDNVRISHGPLASFIGKVQQLAPNERAWVLLDIMGKETKVSLPRTNLLLAS